MVCKTCIFSVRSDQSVAASPNVPSLRQPVNSSLRAGAGLITIISPVSLTPQTLCMITELVPYLLNVVILARSKRAASHRLDLVGPFSCGCRIVLKLVVSAEILIFFPEVQLASTAFCQVSTRLKCSSIQPWFSQNFEAKGQDLLTVS